MDAPARRSPRPVGLHLVQTDPPGAAPGGVPGGAQRWAPPWAAGDDRPPASAAWREGDPVGRRQFYDVGPLALECGVVLPDVRLAYEMWGTLSPTGDNAVLVEHALTGDSHVTGPTGPGHPTEGWWDSLAGPGRPGCPTTPRWGVPVRWARSRARRRGGRARPARRCPRWGRACPTSHRPGARPAGRHRTPARAARRRRTAVGRRGHPRARRRSPVAGRRRRPTAVPSAEPRRAPRPAQRPAHRSARDANLRVAGCAGARRPRQITPPLLPGSPRRGRPGCPRCSRSRRTGGPDRGSPRRAPAPAR